MKIKKEFVVLYSFRYENMLLFFKYHTGTILTEPSRALQPKGTHTAIPYRASRGPEQGWVCSAVISPKQTFCGPGHQSRSVEDILSF